MTEIIEEKIMTKKRFSLAVENLVSSHNINYIDAAAHVIQERGLDYRSMKRLMTDSLKAKIEAEAKSLNLLRVKKTNKLPV